MTLVERMAPGAMDIPSFRKKAKNVVNKRLAELKYTDGIPVDELIRIVESAGFSGLNLQGIYCGDSGRINEDIGYRTYLTLSWYRMPSGRFEIVAYVS